MLSELKARVLTSLRCPPMVILDTRATCGVCADGFRAYVSTVLFWSSNVAFSSPFGDRIKSNDLFEQTKARLEEGTV